MNVRTHASILVALAAGAAASTANAQSITTLFAQNNGGSVGGIVYFDVNITNPIIIDALDLNTTTTGSIGATVYTVPGTYVGNETNIGAWTQVSTGSGTGMGVNTPSPITLDTPFQLNSGTYGIAIVGAAPGFPSFAHSYTNGDGTNQFYSNSDLSLTLGAANNAPFAASPFTPRVWNGTLYYDPANPNAVGACCFNDGTCQFITLANCQSGGGSFRGENIQCGSITCPVIGACCLGTGSCITAFPASCAAQGGAYMGANTTCSATACPQPFMEIGDAGELPATANIIEGTTPLLQVIGDAPTGDDVDMYQFEICDYQNFSVTTTGGATWDTTLFLFNETGFGVVMNDDSPAGGLQSRITSALVPNNGTYYIAVARYSRHPVSAGGRIWEATPFNVERAPDGAGSGGEVSGWADIPTAAAGPYTLYLTGACYLSNNICYANCDGSTVVPVLNVDDFTCFINEFAAAQALPHTQQVAHYANCDGSSIAPALNVDDFTCFINEFAAGCP